MIHPHGAHAYVQMSKQNRIDRHSWGVVRATCRYKISSDVHFAMRSDDSVTRRHAVTKGAYGDTRHRCR